MKSSPVLLVEDEPDHVALLTRMLRARGWREVKQAGSLAEFRQLVAESSFSLVLLDLGLPDGKGLSVVEAVVAEFSGPVVVLTAAEGRTGADAIRLGAQDFLIKTEISSSWLDRSLRYAIERHQLRIDLEEKNRELERFAWAAAHDIRSPLRHIRGFSQLVSEQLSDASEDVKDDLAVIERAAERLLTLVDGLLRYATSGAKELNIDDVALADVVAAALEQLQGAIAQSKAEIHVEDLPMVGGDGALLMLVFQNLVANAIKYCETTPRVHIFAGEHPTMWKLCVSDNGIGVPEDKRERIFSAFTRLHSPTGKYEGAGIGLAQTASIVKRHGGSIWVEDNDGGGSRFWFTLPRDADGL